MAARSGLRCSDRCVKFRLDNNLGTFGVLGCLFAITLSVMVMLIALLALHKR
jgi:hypothetical protein